MPSLARQLDPTLYRALVELYGGLRVSVPHRFGPHSSLIRELSARVEASALRRFVQRYRGISLSIPTGSHAARAERAETLHREIVRRWLQGESARGIAAALGTSERNVLRHTARARERGDLPAGRSGRQRADGRDYHGPRVRTTADPRARHDA